MAVNRMFKLFFRYRKASFNRAIITAHAGHFKINELYRKNRIRFPNLEKRINMLLFFEPLIYFESITNGYCVLMIILHPFRWIQLIYAFLFCDGKLILYARSQFAYAGENHEQIYGGVYAVDMYVSYVNFLKLFFKGSAKVEQ